MPGLGVSKTDKDLVSGAPACYGRRSGEGVWIPSSQRNLWLRYFIGERVSARFDNKRELGTVYGVPALVAKQRVKSEGRNKAEARIALGLGFRSSDFGTQPSFGLRTSACGLQPYLTPLLLRRSGGSRRASGGRLDQSERRIHPAARRSRKSEVRRGPKIIRGRRFLTSGPINRRDAKSAERETFPSIFSLHCYSLSCSLAARNPGTTPKDRIMARQNHK